MSHAITRRHLLGAAAASAAAAAYPALAQSTGEYPSRPVRIIVPFSAGSTTDLSARHLANALSTRMKQQFIVENKPGASGIIGLDAVAKSAPDGHTLVFSGPGLSTFHVLVKSLPFDTHKDLVPVSLVLENIGGVLVNGQVPANTIGEFAAWARANPTKANYGSLGRNTTMLMGEALKKFGDFPMTQIAYPGTPPQILALLRGDIHLAFTGIDPYMADIQSGKLKVLAVTNAKRVAKYPNIPAVAETFAQFRAPTWGGILAPGGTPKPIVDRLAQEIKAVMQTPEMKEAMAKVSNIAVGSTPEEFRRQIDNDMKTWSEVAKAANIQAE